MTGPDAASFPSAAVGRRWQETPAGTRFSTESRTITDGVLTAFLGLSGYTEPLFQDRREAERLGYAGRLVPAALTYIVAEGLVLQTNVLHRTGIALLDVRISAKAPVYVDGTVRVLVEITEARPSSTPGRGVVTSRHQVVDEDGTGVLEYRAVRLVRGTDHGEDEADR